MNKNNASNFVVTLSLDAGEMTLDVASIKEFYFVEDIFSFCVTGKIIFSDHRGILEFGPITGNEKISVVYGEEVDTEKVFFIYKISDISKHETTENGRNQLIEIFFVDQMFYSLNFFQFSKSWSNKRISDIITDISKNILGVTTWGVKENTTNSLDIYYSPYWSPHTNLKWLLQRGIGQDSKSPGFCFYNNNNGSNLVTLDKLLNEPLMEIGGAQDKYYFDDYDSVRYNNILDWSISSIDNIALKNIAGSTWLGYNSLTKSFLKKEYTYKDTVKKHTILGQKTLFNDCSESRSGFINTEETSIKDMDTIYFDRWNKQYDYQQVIKLLVRGSEHRYCGGLIEIEWPSKDETDQRYNKNLSGYYLIKSITNYFDGHSRIAFKQKMLCIKNGYEDSDARLLIKSTKKNISG